MLLVACIDASEEVTDSPGDDRVEQPVPDDASLEAADVELEPLVDVGELDGVIRMLPPSGQPLPAGMIGMGPNGTVVSQRSVLSLATPNGRADMYEVMLDDPDLGTGLQRCQVVIEGNGVGASCGAAAEPSVPIVGFVGASGSDDSTLYELMGPVDMTHFIIDLGEQRLAVVTREGRALLYVAGRFCEDPAVIDGAWRGEESLVVTAESSC